MGRRAKTEIVEKRERGRPSLRERPEVVEKIMALAREGKTDMQIAEIVGVSHRTICNWKANDWEFSSYLKENKQLADDLVEASMFKAACGYEYWEQALTRDGLLEVRKHQPPNATSQIFWLKNRRPKNWKDRVEVGTDASGIITVVSKKNGKEQFDV